MREIKAQQITDVVKNLCIKANCYLPADVKIAVRLDTQIFDHVCDLLCLDFSHNVSS